MAIADYKGAGVAVGEYHDLLAQHRNQHADLAKVDSATHLAVGGLQPSRAYREGIRMALTELDAKILRLQPLIEDIARGVDPAGTAERFGPDGPPGRRWRWTSAMEATQRLVGRLRDMNLRSEILGPVGPLLAANRLHPWVWNAAVDRWASGHWADAVGAAARAVEELTQQQSGLSSTSGPGLFSLLFSTEPPAPDKPRLRFADIAEMSGDGKTSQKWTSAHDGAAAFGRGCAQGIRNMQAHGTAELSEQEAIEYLAALSVLARWVDAAELVTSVSSAA